jgi:hypothetical protein
MEPNPEFSNMGWISNFEGPSWTNSIRHHEKDYFNLFVNRLSVR